MEEPLQTAAASCDRSGEGTESPLSPFFSSSTGLDMTAAAIAMTICVGWLKAVDAAVYFNLLDMRFSRKVIHIGTGPIFLLTWNLFSETPEARYFAAVVPLLVTAQFFLIGIGAIHDPQAVASMSRRGDPAELLRGPLYYGIVFVVSTIVFWRNSPLGVLALSVLCGGDGLAEVFGRKYGRAKLPWSSSKSYVGTAAMFGGSFLFGLAYLFPDELLAASPAIAAALRDACNPPAPNHPANPPSNQGADPKVHSNPLPKPTLHTPASVPPNEPTPQTPQMSPEPALNPPNPPRNPATRLPNPGSPATALVHTDQSSEEKGPVRVFVLADTTYGSCCVDEVAAAHADAQCVIHFGRACLSQTSRLPARFVFGSAPVDVPDCSAQLRSLAERKGKPLLVLFGLEYAHAVPQLRKALEASENADVRFADLPSAEMEPASTSSPCEEQPKSQKGLSKEVQNGSDKALSGERAAESMGDLGGGSQSQLGTGEENGNKSVLEDRSHSSGEERTRRTGDLGAKNRSARPGLGDYHEGRTAVGESESASPSGAIMDPIENESFSRGDATAERIQFSTEAQSSGSKEEFRGGGLTWRLKPTETMTDLVTVWVGSEGPALTDVMLTYNQYEVVRYDPGGKRLVTDVGENSKFLRRRYYLVERAKNASIVGIVVGTLSSAGYLDVIKRLRHVITDAGKKSYTFVMGKPNPAKLANFPECEVFVLVACPQTALLDSKEYLSPVITPFEAELAFVEQRVWTGEYRLDYGGLADNEGLGAESVGNGDEEPRFSLISGAYESRAVQGGSGNVETSSALAMMGNGVKDLQVGGGGGALTLAGERSQQIGAKSGAEYLVSKRTYQGLSVPQHLRQEDDATSKERTPVELAVKGRTGRAAEYSDEK